MPRPFPKPPKQPKKMKNFGREELSNAAAAARPPGTLPPGLQGRPLPPGLARLQAAGRGPFKPGGPFAGAPAPATTPPASGVTSPGASTSTPPSATPAAPGALGKLKPHFGARRLGGGPKPGRGYLRPGFRGRGRGRRS